MAYRKNNPSSTLAEASEQLSDISFALHDLLEIMKGLSPEDKSAFKGCCSLDLIKLTQTIDTCADDARFIARTPKGAGGRASNPAGRDFAVEAGNEILNDRYMYDAAVHCIQLAEREIVNAAGDRGLYGAVDADELIERSIPILKRGLVRAGYDSALTDDGRFSPAGIRYAVSQLVSAGEY